MKLLQKSHFKKKDKNKKVLLMNLNSMLNFVAELGLLGLNTNFSIVCTKATKFPL